MLSPVQRNQLRRRAALESAATAPAMTMEGATAYEQQLMALAQDRLRLKQVQSGQGKERIRGHHCTGHLKTGMLGFDGSDTR